MTKTTNCIGCTSQDDKGDCTRSIIPIRRTERVPECFAASPESMAVKYYGGAKEGYESIDTALATLTEAAFTNEQPLFAALNAGVGPHVTDLTQEGLHHLAGFLAGAANRIRESLAALSQLSPQTTINEEKS